MIFNFYRFKISSDKDSSTITGVPPRLTKLESHIFLSKGFASLPENWRIYLQWDQTNTRIPNWEHFTVTPNTVTDEFEIYLSLLFGLLVHFISDLYDLLC